MKIGNTVKNIRKERKMTLVTLSDKSGVALATLSRIENGKMTGTLESHIKISGALGVALPDLYKDISSPKKALQINKRKSCAEVFVRDRNSSEEALASNVSGKKMIPVLIRLSKGACTRKEESPHGSEKFVYLLDGKIEAVIGSEKYPLGRNDSLYFASNTPHYFRNTGNSDASLIVVCCPSS